MPGYRRGFGRSRRAQSLNVINSEKHIVDITEGLTTTNSVSLIAKAVTAPSNTIDTDCHRGGVIKAIWISLDFCGLGNSGANNRILAYLIKNPGDNLTPPGVFSVGTSNEKKFVVKMWSYMAMRNQEGNPPYHWEGWLKLPKRYHRMGTDDTWSLVSGINNATGHLFANVIYKEYF